MEIPPYPPTEEQITHVYQLYYQKNGERPTAIPCSSLVNLKKQVLSIAMRSDTLEPRFKTAISLLMEQASLDAGGMLERAVETFRKAQLGNNVPLGFDMWWEEEPQVLL